MFIFDLDGTLSDNGHRIHLLEKGDWETYNRLCGKDRPIKPVINLFNSLSNDWKKIQVWSGRSEIVREETIEWFRRHVSSGFNPAILKMRSAGDTSKNDVLKQRWVDELSPIDLAALKNEGGMFDDQPDTVQMFRQNGITCFDVGGLIKIDESLRK